MTLLKLMALTAFGCLPMLGAAGGDAGNPFVEVTKPSHDRIDRAWKRYRNESLNYCLNIPSRWSKGDAFDGSGLFVKTGLSRHSKAIGEIDFGPIPPDDPDDVQLADASLRSSTLDQDLTDQLEGLQKFARAERVEILERAQLKLQGSDALFVKSSYYDPLENKARMQEVVFVARKGNQFRIELDCPPDQIKRFEAVFAYMVNSFEANCNK